VEIDRYLQDRCKQLSQKLPKLTIDAPQPCHLVIQTDSDFLDQILENILLNAFEAGGPGTRVRIKVSASETDPSTVAIEIEDDGPGISAGMLPDRLFVPFKTSKPDGTGIGLWQARKLIEMLGGTIEARKGESGGAKFVIRMPVEASVTHGHSKSNRLREHGNGRRNSDTAS
jgi:signal transduction histidine kinase